MKKLLICARIVLSGKAVLLAAAIIIIASCNKPFPNNLPVTTGSDSAKGIARKTLFIVVDGAVGSEVYAAVPPTLNSLTDFSIYSWDALNDYVNHPITNALATTTLLTGTTSDKHNVTGNDFTGNRLATYPTLFTRLKTERPGLRTAAFCSSPEIATNLATDATVKNSYGEDDAAVKEAVKSELSTNNPALVFAQFHDVDKAGAASAYNVGSVQYKDAILKVDAYIGEILTAMRARPTFKNENWMVVITSNKGSNTAYTPIGTPWSAFEDKRHNTFFFCYNPRFKSQNPSKPTVIPYIGSSAFYSGTQSLNRRSKVLDGGTTYDMGATGNYTIQCKVKFPTGSFNYPAFLSKRAGFVAGAPGWVLFREGDFWQVNFGQTSLGNRQIRGHAIADGLWHTLTVVVRQEGAARNVYTYTDGVLYTTGISAATRDITSYGNLNSPAPLTVGNLPPDNNTSLQNYLVTDIRIYNDALSDTYIAGNYCKTNVDATDPYKSKLLGFWPSTSVTPDQKMLDESGNNHHLVIESYNPATFTDVTNNVCPSVSEAVYRTVPNSVDVAVQIYQWIGIPVPSSWGLDGKNWIPAYSDLGG
jgi:hypothetical protein